MIVHRRKHSDAHLSLSVSLGEKQEPIGIQRNISL